MDEEKIARLLAATAEVAQPTAMMRALARGCVRHWPAAGVDTARRMAHNVAQASVETGGFDRLVESLNYAADRLVPVFGRHRISPSQAAQLGRRGDRAADQPAIANTVYGGDWGRANLGNVSEGDGWRYRGRGWKMTTGRRNYGEVARATGLGVLTRPELLEEPDTAVRAGAIFWAMHGCNELADRDDIVGLTRRVNGGANGLDQRRAALARAKRFLGV